MLIEPVSHLPAFLINHQLRMASARRNHHRNSGGLLFRRQENIDGRPVHNRKLRRQTARALIHKNVGGRVLHGAQRDLLNVRRQANERYHAESCEEFHGANHYMMKP